MPREIILPAHLYDRIKASAGEHGGIGHSQLFVGIANEWDQCSGEPLCAHGHAWGTKGRYFDSEVRSGISEPELRHYLSWSQNDLAVSEIVGRHNALGRIPFAQWCELLNVKRGVEAEVTHQSELVSVA